MKLGGPGGRHAGGAAPRRRASLSLIRMSAGCHWQGHSGRGQRPALGPFRLTTLIHTDASLHTAATLTRR